MGTKRFRGKPAFWSAILAGLLLVWALVTLWQTPESEAPGFQVRTEPAGSAKRPRLPEVSATPSIETAVTGRPPAVDGEVTSEETITQGSADHDQLWDALNRGSEGAVFGSLTADEVFDVTTALLTQLDPDAKPVIAGDGRAAYTLLDDPERGTATLYRQRASHGSGAEFELVADVTTEPGHFTGYAADRAETTRFAIGIDFGEDDATTYCSAVAQPRFHHTAGLAAHLEGRDPIPIAGALTIRHGEAEWRPITLRLVDGGTLPPEVQDTATGNPGDGPGWLQDMGDPQPAYGSLTDERMDAIAGVLRKTRSDDT